MSVVDTLTGQKIKDYIIGPMIGRGAMGEVYQIFTGDTAKPMAMKIMRGEYASDLDFQHRFTREVSLMKALKHPNILPVFDSGVYIQENEQSLLYFVMPLIGGSTLSYLMNKRRFSLTATWNVIKPIASALEYGHSQGVIHRDVKPGNVLIEQDRDKKLQVFVTDYGLGKRPGIDATLTEVGVSIGTPEYMSPEAALGEDIDIQTDVYSLAVVAYELAIGILPFSSKQPHLTALAHVNTPPPPLISRCPDFPVSVQAIIMRGLEKDKQSRYKTVREFGDALYKVIRKLPKAERDKEFQGSKE